MTRRARPFDAAAMAAIVGQLARPGPGFTPAFLRDWIAAAGDIWVVAEVDTGIEGFQWCGSAADLPPHTCEIATFVPPGRHDLQVGSGLFDATRHAARELELRWIVARTAIEKEGAHIYYRSRGFEDASEVAPGTGQSILIHRL